MSSRRAPLSSSCRRRLTLLVVLAVLAGCRRSGIEDCNALLEAGKYADALARCRQVYDDEGDPLAGNAAARAHYYLGQREEVFPWLERLAGTAGERGLWSLAAAVHRRRGEMPQAKRAFERDLELMRAVGDQKGMAAPLYGLFFLAWQDAHYREALALAGESYTRAQAAGDRAAQARAAEGLFTVLYDVGDLGGARRALEMAASLTLEQTPLERTRFLANEGLLLRAEGKPRLGALKLEQAVMTGADDERAMRSAHLDLVELYLDAGRVDDAEAHLKQAWTHAEETAGRTALLYYQAAVDLARARLDEAARGTSEALADEPAAEWAWDLENLQGLVALARGDLAAAEAAFERSTRHVEEIRRALELGDLKSWLLDKKRKPFESLFLLQARAGRGRAALATAERAQARTLLDAFIQATSAASPRPGQANAETAAADRLETLRAIVPAMSASPVAALLPLPDVLARLGDRHALVYFTAGEEMWLASVSKGAVGFRSIDRSAATLRALAERFAARPDDGAIATELGSALLPDGVLPGAGRTLHVVADGALAQVPFAALRSGERRLVQDHAVVYVPSLTALAAIEARAHGAWGPAIVLADPRGDLAASAAEALTVQRLARAALRTSRQATAAELGRARQARLLHLATHSGLDSHGPWLRLADRDVGAPEIVSAGIAPRLVVLASCASAARERREMWGSLAAAFLAAGARSVVASLGSVEDEAARRFVLRFYEAGGDHDPVGALARAQRAAIAAGEPPAEWASFAVFGSDPEVSR